MGEELVVLVVGACCLDRLLIVPRYPEADAKIRTSSYHEIGGGNSANTAAAIARLKDAQFLNNQHIRVKYLGKVGQDAVGRRLLEELEECSVDTSSPLCLRGPVGSTTSFTTIVVSEAEHTRTCFHTPGSCGILEVEDCHTADMDSVFENVVHLHSDTRHISASLLLAKEAARRGITTSCDCEKDRGSIDLDELLEISDVVFTDANYLGEYLHRLTKELEEKHRLQSLPPLTVYHDNSLDDTKQNVLVNSLVPAAFFSRWYPRSSRQVVVTQGRLGALHFTGVKTNDEVHAGHGLPASHTLHITTNLNSRGCIQMSHHFFEMPLDIDPESYVKTCNYLVTTTGAMRKVSIIDTTGAGDAFIGGYLLASLVSIKSSTSSTISFNLRFGAWVAGKKLESRGVREALPTAGIVDRELGRTIEDIDNLLDQKISEFNEG